MAVKFTYDQKSGYLDIKVEGTNVVTEQQAMIIATWQAAWQFKMLAEGVWTLAKAVENKAIDKT